MIPTKRNNPSISAKIEPDFDISYLLPDLQKEPEPSYITPSYAETMKKLKELREKGKDLIDKLEKDTNPMSKHQIRSRLET